MEHGGLGLATVEKVSAHALARLIKACNSFIQHLNSLRLDESERSRIIQISTPEVHLVDKCWPLFRDFVTSFQCVAKRKKASMSERSLYGIVRKGEVFFVNVEFSREAVERARSSPASLVAEDVSAGLSLMGVVASLSGGRSAAKGRVVGAQKSNPAYSMYCGDKLELLAAQYPDASRAALGKRLAESWDAEPDEVKERYATRADEHDGSALSSDKGKQADGESEPRQKKRRFDPANPTRKQLPSAYIFFCSDKREEVRLAHPGASFGRIGTLLGERWRQAPQAVREEYKQRSDREKQRVREDPSLRSYHTEETALARMRHKRLPDPSKAKRPASAYIVYCHEKREEMKLLHPEATFGQVRTHARTRTRAFASLTYAPLSCRSESCSATPGISCPWARKITTEPCPQ